MTLCCICGDPFKHDDYVLRLAVYRFDQEDQEQRKFSLLRVRFEDNSEERFAHLTCPVEAGAPMSLIGADGERTDV